MRIKYTFLEELTKEQTDKLAKFIDGEITIKWRCDPA